MVQPNTEWIPESQTFTQLYHLEVLGGLHEKVRKERPDLWKDKS